MKNYKKQEFLFGVYEYERNKKDGIVYVSRKEKAYKSFRKNK